MEFCRKWTENNIYNFRKLDGTCYFFLYILIPVAITIVSLKHFPADRIAAIYCYLSILISGLNCAYDIINRWKNGCKTFFNTKLFIMSIPVMIIIGYCLFLVLHMLIANGSAPRADFILWGYVVTMVVAISDIFVCFAQDLALRDFAKSYNE